MLFKLPLLISISPANLPHGHRVKRVRLNKQYLAGPYRCSSLKQIHGSTSSHLPSGHNHYLCYMGLLGEDPRPLQALLQPQLAQQLKQEIRRIYDACVESTGKLYLRAGVLVFILKLTIRLGIDRKGRSSAYLPWPTISH